MEKDPDLIRARIANTYSDDPVKFSMRARDVARLKARYRKTTGRPWVWANGLCMGRPPETPREVEQGWDGVVRLLSYFNMDKELAARTLGVSVSAITKTVRDGYVPVYLAVLAHHRCDTLGWNAWGLVPYLDIETHEWEWDHWLAQYDEIVAAIEERRERMKNWWKEQKKNPDRR